MSDVRRIRVNLNELTRFSQPRIDRINTGEKPDARTADNLLFVKASETKMSWLSGIYVTPISDSLVVRYKQVRNLATDPDAVEFALWYHDAIYDTKAKDSEERSAALAVEMARNASLPDNFGQSVSNFTMATKHAAAPTDPDVQLFVDIDLSILGQSENRFNEYERQVRKEYEWVPQDQFVAGRSAILKSFLDRPNIYSTRFFRNKYETQARANIARSLARLRA